MISWRQLASDRLASLPAVHWPEPAVAKTVSFEAAPSTIVFVDGFFAPELSKVPAEVICLKLDQALKSYGLFLQNRWTKTFKDEKDPFYLLNMLHHGQGLFLYIPPNVQSSLHIVHLSTGPNLASPKIQITLGKNSHLSLTQKVQGGIVNGAIDLLLDAGSTLKFYDIELLEENANVHTSLRASLKKDARLEVFHATDGAKNVRFSAIAELAEENSSFLFRSLAMLNGKREAHVHALADHVAPNCTSRQHVKMVLNGESKSSFEGKIYVHPKAQKTAAYQLNNNLLLSDTALATSKPNLEIFADDVKASHGATFSQLSEEELFYFRSRGLSLTEAKSLLMQAFCREHIDALEIESLKAPLLDAMARVYA